MAKHKDHQLKTGLINLDKIQLERIHHATLEVLGRTGVRVQDREALSLLSRAGAEVNGDRVAIPPSLVEQALCSAPGRIALYDRRGNPAMMLEPGRIYFGPGSDTPYIIDLESGKRRFSLKKDTVSAALVTDALENLDFIMSAARASDVPGDRADRHHFETMTLNSIKPVVFDALDRRGLLEIIEMAALAVGGRQNLAEKPYIVHYAEPTSPLIHSGNAMQKLLTAAAEGIPLIYAPAVMCGATGPVTTAGSLVVANAECLSGLVVHQLKREGAPFIHGGGTPPLNMITTVCSYGDPQGYMGLASMVQLGRYYNLPSFTAAGCTDAHLFDQQAAMEAGFNLLLAALAGGNMIHNLGYTGAGMTFSLEFLVLCNEGAGKARFVTRGMEVDPLTLALDVIEQVGPGGHYLTEQHTLDHFRSEMHFTKLFNRNNYENWLAAGGQSCCDAARARVREILQWHEVPPLGKDVEEAIRAIASGAGSRRELA